MKHWIEFLPNKTHETKRMGKIATSIEFEKQNKEIELKGLEETEAVINAEIVKQLLPFYSCNEHLITEIVKAQKQAEIWNTTPTIELQNPNLKK